MKYWNVYTELIKEENNCQLRQAPELNGFYFISTKTGIHYLNEPCLNERVKAHWIGFLKNQE
jgi:hypothetical protein